MTAWLQPRSLRLRLALWYALGGTVLLAIFSALLYGFVARRVALSPLLREDLVRIQSRLAVTSDRRVLWDGREVPGNMPWKTQDPWFELWDENGQLVRRLWPFTENKVERLPTAPTPGLRTLAVFRISSSIPLRVYSMPYRVPDLEPEWMIRVIRVHEPTSDLLAMLRTSLLIALPLMVLLLVTGGYLITRRWLKPLEVMVQQAEHITADKLDSRLPGAENGDEIGRLAGAFNRTLGRLEDSFRTLDCFVADASHELRTPLTALRSVGEVGLQRSRTAEEYREIIGSMLEEAQRLQQLVDRLLEFARFAGDHPPVRREPVQLDRLVAACLQEIGLLAEAKGQRLVSTLPAGAAATDPVLLYQALQNLVHNAVKFSPPGTTIQVALDTTAAGHRIEVRDEGPGIPAAHAGRITDRFYRVDGSRGRDGFGLGLAITKTYMHALGGRLEYTSDENGSCFSLVLPREEASSPVAG